MGMPRSFHLSCFQSNVIYHHPIHTAHAYLPLPLFSSSAASSSTSILLFFLHTILLPLLCVEYLHRGIPLFYKLLLGRVHPLPTLVSQRQVGYDLPFSILAFHREGEDEAFCHSVASIRCNRHRHKFTRLRAHYPIAKVIGYAHRCGESRRQATSLNHSCTPLLNGGDEFVVQPLVVAYCTSNRICLLSISNESHINVRVLSTRMIAEYAHVGYLLGLCAYLCRNLSDSSVVIETSKGGEVLFGDARRILLQYQAVGIGRISNHYYFYALFCHLVEGFTLHGKDATVLFEEVLPLHTSLAREGTEHGYDIHAVERLLRISVGRSGQQEGESDIFNLHYHPFHYIHCRWDVEHAQVYTDIRPEGSSIEE
mmetsp:Transcript_20992/g.54225  ORF Transcript_20992/g.54225 Transcript_20992/m.54225 type:complete len:368 (-) Transcript_20992:155-1258(-)